MNIGLYGIDQVTESLAREIASSNNHCLVWYCGTADSSQRDLDFLSSVTTTKPAHDWLTSLCNSGAEMVIVSAQAEAGGLLDAIRRMADLQLRLLLSHPLHLSALTYYEIELIASDSAAPLLPLIPARSHPAFRALTDRVRPAGSQNDAEGEMGSIQQVEMERSMAQCGLHDGLRVFARDVDLIRQLSGNLTEVSAMGGGGGQQDVLPLTVQMSGPHGVLARWAATTSDGQREARLTVTGTRGKAHLEMRDADRWCLRLAGGGEQTFDAARELDAVLEDFDRSKMNFAAGDGWPALTHSLEITEAVDKSLQRGRMVKLKLEGRGESSAFKGTMASVGCGLLIGSLLLLVLSAVVLKLAKASGLTTLALVIAKVPYVLAGIFALFLLMQGLRYLIPSAESDELGTGHGKEPET